MTFSVPISKWLVDPVWNNFRQYQCRSRNKRGFTFSLKKSPEVRASPSPLYPPKTVIYFLFKFPAKYQLGISAYDVRITSAIINRKRGCAVKNNILEQNYYFILVSYFLITKYMAYFDIYLFYAFNKIRMYSQNVTFNWENQQSNPDAKTHKFRLRILMHFSSTYFPFLGITF